MRITCPNCGAQYEVPDEVIPTEGRDVQCSNCGDTWYQAHPDHVAEEVEEVVEAAPPPMPEVGTASPRRVDPEVAEILREEAAHETRLRARESAALESQGELGLEQATDEAKAREQRDRMARMRGEPVSQPDRPRSRLLPDVEEINSTLSKSDKAAPAPEASAVAFPVAPPAKRGGFGRGFLTVVVLAVVLAVVYLQASRIAEAVPALAPALEGYTSAVNSARLWIDTKLSAYIPR